MNAIWWSIRPLLVLSLIYGQSLNVCGATLCSPPCLLVTNTSDVVALDYKTAALSSIVSGLSRAVAIDVHFSLGYIFWSDVTEKNIKRFRIDFGNTTTIVTGIGVCDGLAVDWRASQLYWTDTTYDTISVSDLDGNNQVFLISSGLEEPREIALDLDNSLMFWTDWGINAKIEKASLSGGQRVAIVTTYLYYPNGIELDRGSKRIFWVDAGYERVESADYNGNNRKLLYYPSGLHPFGLALIPPFLFFTNWYAAEDIHQLDATTGNEVRKYSVNGGQPMGIVAYDASRQPAASNPCTVNNGGCSHFCVTKSSGYECVCPTGLTVKQDRKTCEDKATKFILFADADDKSTKYVSLDTNYFASQTLFYHLGTHQPIALDYDPVKDRVYWSDIAQGRIISAFFNATSVKTLFRCNVGTPDGLAIDHVGRNIYWTDTGTNRIEVGLLDGSGRKLLIKDGLDEPRAIVLDERNGIMYWTDWGATSKIEQAEMDGSARRTIVTGNLVWPNGLTIDQATNRLFWTDAKLDKIEVSDLNGENRQLIMSSSANIHPYGLAVYLDILYWTDWNTKSISRYNLSSGNQDIVVNGLQKPMDIHVFDPALIFSGFHNCSHNNGYCSDFCLLKPGGYRCACPTGIALKSDGKTCDHAMFHKTSSEKFVIFAEADSGEIYKVPLEVPETLCYPLGISTNISRPVAVDYDPVEGKIYWTDVTSELVARAFPNGSSFEVIAHSNVITPGGLAVDYAGRNIYWTDEATSRIEVARLDGSSRRSLITSSVEPRAILLDLKERKMYWGSRGLSSTIEQANMDGSARTSLVSSGLLWVNSLSLDYQNRLLYWCDAYLDKIERVDLQGNNRVLILDLSLDFLHPFGLALFGDALYWSDWNSHNVHKYNMTTSLTEVVVQGMGTPMELHVYDQSKDFAGSTSCSQLNGGCSNLCLPNPSGYQCFCPEGIQLKPGDAYTCQGVNRCPLLTAPAYGSVAPCANLPGHSCHFSCDSGYSLTGVATRTCNSNGVWTGTQPQCNAVTCAPLSIPHNATLLTISCGTTIGSNCVFGCQDGYGSSQGNVTRTCLQTGQWSGNPISCTDIDPPTFGVTCPASPLLVYAERGLFSAQLDWNEPVAIDNSGVPPTLTSNYQPHQRFSQGTRVIVYTAEDQSGNKATCSFTIAVIVINCTSLINPGGPLLMSSCGNHFGAKCNFSCTSGYRLNGSSTVTCVAPGNSPPGSWDSPLPICQAITCPALLDPSYGTRQSCSGTTLEYYNTICLFSCNVGFNGHGSSSRQCQEDGTWSGQDFICIAHSCGPVNLPPGAMLLTVSCGNTYESSCVLGCQSGYASEVGNVTTTCLQSGQWSGNSINCTDILPPTFGETCPSSMLVVYAERGLFSAEVNWTEPAATDNSEILPTISSNHKPFERFSQGTHVIIYTTVDQSGNKATCTFTIDVRVINCTLLTVDPGLPMRMSSCSNHFGAKCNFSCTIGYRLNGSSTVTCVAPGNRPPGSWDGPLPSCQAITCPALPAPSYGTRQNCSGTTLEYYNTVCMFSCNVGFNGYGSSSRQCQKDGTWSGQDFICLAHSCGPVNIPPGATLLTVSCGNTYGSSCVLGCQSGYDSIAGNVTTTCLQSGQWSGNPINCTDILPPTFGATCPTSPLVAYAERGLFSTEVNWTEPFATDNSGILPTMSSNHKPFERFSQGTHVITYTAADQSGNKATCTFTIDVRVINCTSLTVDPGLQLRMSSCESHFGAKCNFSCTIGYRLNGSSTVTCVAPGNKPPGYWDSPLPSCEAIRCMSLPVPTNGVKVGCSDITSEPYDTHCSFSCNVGYNLTGSPVRRCLQNGTWSGQTFYCQVVRCPTLPGPANGVKTGCTDLISEPYGTQCNFSCNNGYSLNGSSLRHCQESGTWSGESPICQDILPPTYGATCPSSPLVMYAERGLFSAEVNWTEPAATDNSGILPTMSSNHKPFERFSQGKHVITYITADQSGNKAICTFTIDVRVINCTSLIVDPGFPLRMNNCGNHFGAKCNFSCTIGHRLNGSSMVTCIAPGNKPPGYWDRPLPSCEAIRCMSLPVPTSGVKAGCSDITSEPYDTHCSFSCNVGYNLTGSPVRRCLENGTWSGQTSYCQVVRCPNLPGPANGDKTGCTDLVSEPYNTQCNFFCNDGFYLIGSSVRQCQENGTWSGEPPFCQATLCSPPCLLLSNTTDILAVDYRTAAVRSIISGLKRAVAVDVHFSLGYIFWSDVTERNIKRFGIDVARTATIITGIGVCDGLAVDWRASELYWTDTTNDTISVSDLDGYNQRTLISLSLDEPRAITLDLDSGLMIWTDWGINPKIERASLSGSQRHAVVTTNLFWPNGIELDRGSKRIFWVDAGNDRVESVDYNGNNRKLLYQLQYLHPFDVALIPPFLFFTDWVAQKEFHQVDAATGHVLRSFSISGGQPMGIVPYDSSRQPSASNPCAVNNGGCSHFCVAKSSGRECACPTGLTVKRDGKTCEDKVNTFLLFVDAEDQSTNKISLDVSYFVAQTLFIHLGNQLPIALDYDPVEDRVYWSDISQGRIISAFSNATSVKILFRCNVQTPDGLAIDHVGRNIYWTDTGTNRIEVGRLDGRSRKLLIKDGLDEPRAIMLDERNGMMYWTDWGANPKIERAGMDNSARQTIVAGNLVWPNGLTIDGVTNRLFWADAKLDKIEVSDLNGGNRQLILSSVVNIHPYGLTVYKDMLFWTDWHTKSISRFNLSSGNQEIIVNGLQKPMDIHVFDPALMFSGSHPCAQNNGLCSDLCLLNPGGYKCACPTGIQLKPDGKSCDKELFYRITSNKFMIFAEADAREIYKIPLEVAETPCLPLAINTNISRPVAVDYDPVEGKVYWTDVTLKLVASSFPNGSSVELIAYSDVTTPGGLAVDYVGRTIYWTDEGTSRIEVAKLDGSSRRGLITSNIEKPRAILLDISERKMYWGSRGLSSKIEQANMDGSNRATLVSSGLKWVNSLAIDYRSRLLYWCDAYLARIERIDLQGNNRKLILDLSLDLHPFGLALHSNILYWSDWNSRSIHKYNMTSSVTEVVVRGMGTLMELHIYDHTETFNGSTNCSQSNGGCSHLCLPNPQGSQCSCPEGIQLKPDDPLLCEGVNRCPQLSTPPNGHLETCSDLPGETCRFSCESGYILNGSVTRTCDSNGRWTGTEPQCNAITCPALAIPTNGIRNSCTGIAIEYYDTVCQFSCHSGHIGMGSSSRRCLENGTWSGQDFNCTAITCSPLSTPARAIMLSVSCGNIYGSNCVFGCQSGYGSADGNVTRTCLQTGEWSGNAINCTDVLPPTFGITCPISPLLVYAERGMFSAQTNWDEPVATDNIDAVPSLTSNYRPPQRFTQGSHVITYTAVDQSGNRATCTFAIKVKVINCTSPTVDLGSALKMSSCGNHFGAQCNFTCAIGHRLNGSSTVTCVAPGNRPPGVWDNPLPRCQAIKCPFLPVPTNGVKTGCTNMTSEPYDTRCTFSCNVGYSMVGLSVRRCLENGTWSGETSYCQVITCGPLVPPTDGVVHVSPSSCLSSSPYGQTCIFTCQRPGYVLEGTSARVCSNNGQWTGINNTNCRDNTPPSFNNTCPDNMVFYATECSSSALLTWIEPKATDNSGHVSISYPAIRPPVNLGTGLYSVLYSAIDNSGNRANCTFIVQVARKSCPVLQPPIYGSITSLSCGSTFGSQASLTCNKGYRMIGSPLRSCRADGIWSGNVTSCNIVKCPQITTPRHGMVFPSACQIPSGVNYKTECFFMCNVTVGFQLEGASKVSCLESGSWSEDTSKTICRDIQAPSITCPPDMDNIPTEPGKSYANVNWQLPVLNDNSNENLILTGSRPPQKLDVGKKHITYKVTDSSGLSRSCIFFIHVKDLEPPKIANCPGGIYKTSEEKWTKIFFPGVTVTDNVGVHLLTTDRQNGSMFTWGEHNVTYTASDIAGNTAKCHFQVIIVAKSCDELRTPQNGAKACNKWLDAGTFCTLHCNVGYDFANRPPEIYICGASGKWAPGSTVPDCSKTRPAQTLLALEYHYLSDKCTEEIHDSIASNFIALYTTYLGTVGGCDENEECTIENVGVECGDQSGTLRRRDLADSEQASKVPLTVKFDLRVPLPSNASMVGLNETTQQISSDILASLNEAELTLNVSGVVLEYDSSKPPVVRIVGIVCDKGQVLKGTHCVNCPVGYFFSSTGCQACAEDHYQDKEAQIECVTCPSGTSTFGQTGSKENEDCQELRNSSSTGKQGMPAKILYPVIALVSVLVIAVTVFAIYCLRKRRRDNRLRTANAGTQNHGMQHDNPAYGQASSEPEYMEIDSYQRPVSQPDVGFRNPHFDPGDHYQSLDNANERPDHTYGRLEITGVRSQSYV